MDSEHTDQAFEAALARGLRRDTGHREHCPDPELFAAYVDGTLARDERSAWESHVAGCGRCQAHLAALARTAPVEAVPAGRVASRLGWLFEWHWVAAVSTVAIIVVAVWVADPDRLPGSDTPTVGDAGAARLAEEAPAERALREAPAERAQQDAPAAVSAAAPIGGAQPLPEAAGEPARAAQRENAFAAPAETPAEVDALSSLDQQRLELAAVTAPRDQTAPAAASERRSVNTPLASSTPQVAFRARAVNDATLTIINSPARAAVWRIAPNGAIEHSRDGGSTWIVQLADPGAALTAGSAPSDMVCWLVGRAGAVLRTLDGTTWARLPAPAPDDLVHVEAVDAQTATVTTAGGVSFHTVDGGQTWATP